MIRSGIFVGGASRVQERKRASDVIVLQSKGAVEPKRLVTLGVESSVAGHLHKYWQHQLIVPMFQHGFACCRRRRGPERVGGFVCGRGLLCVQARALTRVVWEILCDEM